jgi:hypothetical protein
MLLYTEGTMHGIDSRKNGIRRTGAQVMLFMGTAFAVVLAALAFTGKIAAQAGDWEIVRAEYGFRTQRADVTDVVRHLLWEGRESGRVLVSNQNMGGDPAVGADKTLHIVAENRRHEQREFDFREGTWIDVTLFSLRPERRDNDRPRDGDVRRDDDRIRDRNNDSRQDDVVLREKDDRDHKRDDEDRARPQRLQILHGYWGAQGQMANVTDMLRGRVRDGALHVHVDNGSLGGDPAIGRDKVLIVVYTMDGKELAASTHEGNTMNLP